MNRFNNVIFGQKAFIVKDNKVLIIKRKEVDIFSEAWDVPGGKIEEGDENLAAGISREIREEVGLELTKVVLTLSTGKFIGTMADHPIILRNIYLCYAEGEVQLSKEHSEYLWADVNNLEKYEFIPNPDFQSVLKRLPSILKEINSNIKYSEVF